MPNPMRFLMYVPVPWVFHSQLPTRRRAATEVAHEYKSERGGNEHDRWRSSVHLGSCDCRMALVIFRKNRTTTVPGKSSEKLVTWGPYRFTRNPMYVALPSLTWASGIAETDLARPCLAANDCLSQLDGDSS